MITSLKLSVCLLTRAPCLSSLLHHQIKKTGGHQGRLRVNHRDERGAEPVGVWDPLAIVEYLAECFPVFHLWPSDVCKRAEARSICAEMHVGFSALRAACPAWLWTHAASTFRLQLMAMPAGRGRKPTACASFAAP